MPSLFLAIAFSLFFGMCKLPVFVQTDVTENREYGVTCLVGEKYNSLLDVYMWVGKKFSDYTKKKRKKKTK